ncbi:hypothetical protein BC835DRAFT_1419837 [Cytidiella melzeri]|nr:hypothetical protein BC835DRAFT_1419837 [Cytidiella melzeri]
MSSPLAVPTDAPLPRLQVDDTLGAAFIGNISLRLFLSSILLRLSTKGGPGMAQKIVMLNLFLATTTLSHKLWDCTKGVGAETGSSSSSAIPMSAIQISSPSRFATSVGSAEHPDLRRGLSDTVGVGVRTMELGGLTKGGETAFGGGGSWDSLQLEIVPGLV